MDKIKLDNRVAIVTGSSSGIGEATALLLAKRGAKVTLHGRNEQLLQEVKKKILEAGVKPEKILIVCGDITSPEVRSRIINETVKKFGQLDILVNNAGELKGLFLKDITESDLDFHHNIIYKAPVLLTTAALPHLAKTKGNVVIVSTCLVTESYPTLNVYSAVKCALEYYTKSAAVEFAELGIRFNIVRPGVIDTPIFLKLFAGPNRDQIVTQVKQGHAQKTLTGRVGQSEEVAEAVAYLASDAASYTTGGIVDVDGGRHICFNSVVPSPAPSYEEFKRNSKQS